MRRVVLGGQPLDQDAVDEHQRVEQHQVERDADEELDHRADRQPVLRRDRARQADPHDRGAQDHADRGDPAADHADHAEPGHRHAEQAGDPQRGERDVEAGLLVELVQAVRGADEHRVERVAADDQAREHQRRGLGHVVEQPRDQRRRGDEADRDRQAEPDVHPQPGVLDRAAPCPGSCAANRDTAWIVPVTSTLLTSDAMSATRL